MGPLTHALVFLADRAFRGLAGSAAFTRLLELVSHEDPAPRSANARAPVQLPDLGYRAVPHAGDPIPVVGPPHLQSWQVQWKPAQGSAQDGLGYTCQGGFYLPTPRNGPPRPAVLVLPVLHDPLNLASGALARYLAARGFATLEVRSGASFLDRVSVAPNGSDPTWEDVVAGMIVDGRRGLDWLCARSEVDATRLGIMGVSHGAIVGPCVLGADRRLRAGVFCMGGADEALIVAQSLEPSVRRFRRRFLKAHGLARPEDLLRLGTAATSRTEPMRYAPAVDPESVLLFKTQRDRAVVPEAQDKLWEALGRPRRITLPLGHIGFGVAFYYAARRAAEFFQERLGASA